MVFCEWNVFITHFTRFLDRNEFLRSCVTLNVTRMEDVKSGQEEIVFDLIKPLPYINALRRCILSMIPYVAVDHVQVETNQTLHNTSEFIHMLQMLPIREVPDGVVLDLLLDVHGPSDPDELIRPVTSDSIQVLNGSYQNVIPPQVFLFYLMKGQHVRLRAQTSTGVPETNGARYQLGFASYRILPHVRLPQPIEDLENFDQWIAACPKKVFGYRSGQRHVNEDLCVHCGECTPLGAIVETPPTHHTRVQFRVQSNHGDAQWVYRRGLDVLRERVRIILQHQSDWTIEPDTVLPECWNVYDEHINMTMAQLFVFECSVLPTVSFHAAKVVHPLQSRIQIRIRLTQPATRDQVTEVVEEAWLNVIERIQEWLESLSS